MNERNLAMTAPHADRTCYWAPRTPRGAAIASRWLLLLPLLGMPYPSVAAPEPESQADLTGLAEATMGMSQLTTDGAQCGLELPRIGEAAHQAVANAGIALRDDATNRMTISAVTTRIGPDQCATAVMLGVYAKESFFSAAAGWVQSGYVVLWQRSIMVATPIGQHAAAVIDATRRLTDQMLIDWRARNAPRVSAVIPGDGNRIGNGVRAGTKTAPATPKATQ